MNTATSSTTTSRRRRPVLDRYLILAGQWHPRPIRSAKEYEEAVAMLDRLVGRTDLAAGEQDYLDAVTRFVEDYDDAQVRLPDDTRTSAERLGFLVEAAGLTVAGLGKIVGSQPLASMLLSGQREPSKAVIRKLAAHFKVDPSYFL